MFEIFHLRKVELNMDCKLKKSTTEMKWESYINNDKFEGNEWYAIIVYFSLF